MTTDDARDSIREQNEHYKRLTLTKMFEDMYNHIGDAELDTEVFNEELHFFLDRLREDDYFGTEGQCDPRGDQRDV